MLGGPAKVVWHTTENDPAKTTAKNVATYLVGTGNTVHLVWHPVTGETIQMIPAHHAGRGLENHPGGVETNRAGSVVIQVEVVGRASQPFTSGPMVGLSKILAWVASLGVPPVWSGTEDRSAASWAKAGHFGHMDVPENSHTDPGAVDKAKLCRGGLTTPQTPTRPAKPTSNAAQVKAIQGAVHVAVDGQFGTGTLNACNAVIRRDTSQVRYLQARVGARVDGLWGKASEVSRLVAVGRIQDAIGVKADGVWGDHSKAAWAACLAENYMQH